MPEPTRVLLVDNSALFRRCLADQLNHQPDLQVVGDTATGADAVAQARALQPDVVVLDTAVPEGGLRLVEDLCRETPRCAVLVLALGDEEGGAGQALRAGARGYLQKDSESSEFGDVVRAIKRVQMGELVVAPTAVEAVLRDLRGESAREPGLGGLSPREHEVLRLVAQGRSNAEIARALHITEHTVKGHLAKILRKLALANRVQLATYAMQHGLAARGEADASAPPGRRTPSRE